MTGAGVRPAVPDAVTQWSLWLDAFAIHLAEGREALSAGRIDDLGPLAVPAGLPALPPPLRADAIRLLEQAQELEHGLELAQESVRRQLQVTRRMSAATPAQPSMTEQRA